MCTEPIKCCIHIGILLEPKKGIKIYRRIGVRNVVVDVVVGAHKFNFKFFFLKYMQTV